MNDKEMGTLKILKFAQENIKPSESKKVKQIAQKNAINFVQKPETPKAADGFPSNLLAS